MGYEAKKTEHCGPKRGNGAYWGYKWVAKKESNRIRREIAKREVRDASTGEPTGFSSATENAGQIAVIQFFKLLGFTVTTITLDRISFARGRFLSLHLDSITMPARMDCGVFPVEWT
jgi:hypothetical protein